MALCYRVPNIKLVQGGSVKEPAASEEFIDWSRIRRVRPLDQLLPATVAWANGLPEGIRPSQLLQRYPRVANRLAIAWQDSRAVQEVLDDVLIDRRGGRRGFPPAPLAELLRLRSFVDGGHSLVVATA